MKLRIAALFATAAVVAALVFFVRDSRRDPRTGGSPGGQTPLISRADSDSAVTSANAAPHSALPTAPISASTVASRTPDPRLPAAVAPKYARSAALPPAASAPAAMNAPAIVAPIPVPAADTIAARLEREAAAIDLDKVTLMLRDFRTTMGENPTGTNAEIMKAIMGGNPKGALLGPPENQALNGNGELVDRWGTPVFFHQLSKTSMEVRSAGPDRMMYTEDDIIAH